MAVLYLFVILMNAILHVRQDDEIKDTYPEARGIRETLRIIRSFLERHARFTYLLVYTALFALFFYCIFSVNIMAGKGLLWRIDGKSQYLPYLKYTSDYLRNIITNFLNGNYTIQMYDFSIGMGEDVRSVFRIHPTEFISVFFGQNQLEQLYNGLMVFRFWLSGLAFTAFCRHRDISRRNTLVASFIYIFSGYGLNLATRHPIFHSPVIFFPLLLIAMDRLIEKKGYLFFTVMVALSLATNYYFLYMTTIGLGVYALGHFAKTYKTHRIREFGKMMARIIFFYLLGVGISAVFFLPTVTRALSSERVGNVKTMIKSLLSYGNLSQYKLLVSTVSGRYSVFDIYLGMASVFIPAVIILFFGKIREHLGLKLLIILEAVALMIPAVGLTMSAFSTVTNRWIYMTAMTGAYVVAVTLDDFLNAKVIQIIAMIATTVLYAFACLRLVNSTKHVLDLKLSLIILTITVFLVIFIKATHYVTKNQLTMAMLLISLISLTAHGVYLYGNKTIPFSADFLVTGEEAAEFFEKSEFSKFGNIDDPSFYRCDLATQRDYYENMSVIFGYNSTSIYNSVINADLVNYMIDMDSIGISAVHRIYNLDGRTALQALACVKYYQVSAGKNMGIPYGFIRDKNLSDDDFWVYKNQLTLPVGYSYTSSVSKSDIEDLTPLEKQELMLKSVVIDPDEVKINTSEVNAASDEILERVPKVSKVDKILNKKNNYIEFINADKNNGFMLSYKSKDYTLKEDPGFSITFHRKKGYEIYLKLEDFDTNRYRSKLNISNERFDKMLILRNSNAQYSLGRNDYYVNLGYCQGYGDETVRLTFGDTGSYTLKDMKLYYVPMASYKKNIADLANNSLENVVIDDNTIQGTVNADQDQIMVFSIPFSKGWRAQIDGKSTQLFHANSTYMGIQLPAGNHQIRLSYVTPGIKEGAVISLASLFLSVLLAIILLIKRLTKKEEL